ncbi:MAG TPA: T9SS type A sorting domain-containing protein [Bacteroidia bacterium]|jgi:hypothetical protein|nr:T9SS type A sorting domain-containing protein [Bacteroidia bacterium]
MKKILLSCLMLFLSTTISLASTNVKGGIYSNTTWTKANSPYIITDTVVVFPGVVLTIEPGVTVKFVDNQELEIRQGQLIANGTSTDSITFTSNSTTPTPGIYAGVYLNGGSSESQFRYFNLLYSNNGLQNNTTGNGFIIKECKIQYNINGIFGGGLGNHSVLDSCIIKNNTGWAIGEFDSIQNCTISQNYRGVMDGFTLTNCIIDSNSERGIYENTGSILNCIIMYNGTGVFAGNPVTINNCIVNHNTVGLQPSSNQTITNCIIDSNQTGIQVGPSGNAAHNYIYSCQIQYDSIGVNDYGSNGTGANFFVHNTFENNYFGVILQTNVDSFQCNGFCSNITYGLKYLNAANTSVVTHNYWCEPDSASTEVIIYDGYDNVNEGLVFFMPIDTACSPHVHGNITGINTIINSNLITAYPNPVINELTVDMHQAIDGTITITNVLGQTVYNTTISGDTGSLHKINTSGLTQGVYFLKIESKGQVFTTKVLKI